MRLRFIFLIVICMLSFLNGQEPFNKESSHQVAFNPLLLTAQDSTQNNMPSQINKPTGRAFLFSFAIPGAGELYLRDKKMASIFFGTELVLWSSYLLLNWYANIKHDDYTLYAVAHAGIDPKNKNHEYFVNVEDYQSLNEYNNAMLQQRTPVNMYPDDGSYDWSWDSNDSRKRFESLRMDRDKLKSTGLILIGGVLLNHLVSGIDAIRIAKKNAHIGQKDVYFYFTAAPHGGMQLTMVRLF